MQKKSFDASVADFVVSLRLLIRRARAASASPGISWPQAAILGRLADDGPATIAQLARAERMTPQSMGATIAAIENLGLIVRRPHPTDGRQMNIELTPDGAAERKSAREARRTWMAQAVAQLDDRERETLFAAGEIMKRLVQL